MNEWNEYFKGIAERVAAKSRCFSRKIGAIIVIDHVIVSTGYNGPPRGVPHCDARTPLLAPGCPRKALSYKSGEGLHLCIAAHAERNAIVQAARLGIRIKGGTMYSTDIIPCKDCMIEVINSGIAEVVVSKLEKYDALSIWLADEAKLPIFNYEGSVKAIGVIP